MVNQFPATTIRSARVSLRNLLCMVLLATSMSACGGDDVAAPTPAPPPAPKQPAWKWLHPFPLGEPIADMEAFDNDRAIVVTTFDVLETRDGGTTWERIDLDTFYFDIHRRGNVVSILSRESSVYISSDNGNTWRRATFPSTKRRAHAFWDARHGIIVGGSGDIITTDDGGVTWTSRFAGDNIDFTTVVYIDSLTILAGGADLGPRLVRSTNGGVNWTELDVTDLSLIVHDIDFTGGAIHAVDAAGHVLSSSDLGETWWKATLPGLDLFTVDFVTAVKGAVAGREGRIHITSDGGVTWAPVATQAGTDIHTLSYASENDLWAAGRGGRLYRSVDGGTNWTTIHSGNRFRLSDVSFANTDVGIAVGETFLNGVFTRCGVLTTDDGGVTWRRRHLGASTFLCNAGDLNAVHMIDASHAVAVGDAGSLWTSDDGGATWTQRDAETTDDLLDVDFADESQGVLVTSGGQRRITNDGGATWADGLEATNSPLSLNAVSFSSRNTLMMCGDGGVVWRSTDGGELLDGIVTGLPAIELVDVVALDDNTAVLVGNDPRNKVFRTTNAGASWTEIPTLSGGAAYAMSFGSDLQGYIVGRFGELQITSDGGQTWSNPLVTRLDLWGVCGINDDTAIIVGEDGAILRTDSGGE